jgi:hypothetical protein
MRTPLYSLSRSLGRTLILHKHRQETRKHKKYKHDGVHAKAKPSRTGDEYEKGPCVRIVHGLELLPKELNRVIGANGGNPTVLATQKVSRTVTMAQNISPASLSTYLSDSDIIANTGLRANASSLFNSRLVVTKTFLIRTKYQIRNGNTASVKGSTDAAVIIPPTTMNAHVKKS